MESRRSEFHASNLCILAIIESPEVARIFTTGLSDAGALNAQDFTRFSFLMGQMVGSEAVAFDEVRLGFSPQDVLRRRKKILARFLNTRGGRFFWAQTGDVYPVEFCAYINKEILGIGNDPSA